MIINVETRHLDQGAKRQPDSCPISLAVREAHDFKRKVSVTDASITVYPERCSGEPYAYNKTKGQKEVYHTDAELATIIKAIDNEFLIAPFTFHLVDGHARAGMYGMLDDGEF